MSQKNKNLVDYIIIKNANKLAQTKIDLSEIDNESSKLSFHMSGQKLYAGEITEAQKNKIEHLPSFDGIHQNIEFLSTKNPKLYSPNFKNVQHQSCPVEPQTVSYLVFEQTVQKLKQQIQSLQQGFSVIQTITDQYIEIEQRISNLEQLVHMDQNLFKLRNSYKSPVNTLQTPVQSPTQEKQNRSSAKSTVKRHNMNDSSSAQEEYHIKTNEGLMNEFRQEIKRDVHVRFENVERQISKFLGQAHEIDDKVTKLGEKQNQNTEGILLQIEKFKNEQVQSMSCMQHKNILMLPLDQHSLHDLKCQFTRVDTDIIKIFVQMKKLLDLDYKTTKIFNEVEQLKHEGSDCRLKIKQLKKLMFQSNGNF